MSLRVQLVGHTTANSLNLETGYVEHQVYVTDADELAEFAGRACYQSWNRPNPFTASNEGYLQNILYQEHESVLEHASASFYITGVSRTLTHELVRHRHLSFSELSQRYVTLTEANVVVPPAFTETYQSENLKGMAQTASGKYEEVAADLFTRGLSRKQAREAARAFLLNATETKILVTGNHRAFRDVLKKRGSLHADAEIRELALELYRWLTNLAPNTYQDFAIKSKDGVSYLKKKKVKSPNV